MNLNVVRDGSEETEEERWRKRKKIENGEVITLQWGTGASQWGEEEKKERDEEEMGEKEKGREKRKVEKLKSDLT